MKSEKNKKKKVLNEEKKKRGKNCKIYKFWKCGMHTLPDCMENIIIFLLWAKIIHKMWVISR